MDLRMQGTLKLVRLFTILTIVFCPLSFYAATVKDDSREALARVSRYKDSLENLRRQEDQKERMINHVRGEIEKSLKDALGDNQAEIDLKALTLSIDVTWPSLDEELALHKTQILRLLRENVEFLLPNPAHLARIEQLMAGFPTNFGKVSKSGKVWEIDYTARIQNGDSAEKVLEKAIPKTNQGGISFSVSTPQDAGNGNGPESQGVIITFRVPDSKTYRWNLDSVLSGLLKENPVASEPGGDAPRRSVLQGLLNDVERIPPSLQLLTLDQALSDAQSVRFFGPRVSSGFLYAAVTLLPWLFLLATLCLLIYAQILTKEEGPFASLASLDQIPLLVKKPQNGGALVAVFLLFSFLRVCFFSSFGWPFFWFLLEISTLGAIILYSGPLGRLIEKAQSDEQVRGGAVP